MEDIQLPSVSTAASEAKDVLNKCLELAMGWMRANKLKLNLKEIAVLFFFYNDANQEVNSQTVRDGIAAYQYPKLAAWDTDIFNIYLFILL